MEDRRIKLENVNMKITQEDADRLATYLSLGRSTCGLVF